MKGTLYLLCGLVGGAAGGLLVHVLEDEAPSRSAREARREFSPAERERIEAEVWERVRARLDRKLEGVAAPGAPPAPEMPSPGEVAPTGDAGNPAAPAEPDEPQPSAAEIARDIVSQRFDRAAEGRLWAWMWRKSNHARIPALVEALRAEVARNPKSADLHVALATAYVGELNLNTPAGAQQGIVWFQASAAYDSAIKLEPEHWQARYGKAFGTTFIPEQFGQRPNAIKQFEELRKIQEGRAPEPHYVDTYVQLGRLYKDEGNLERARKIWEEGIKLFPENQALKQQLEVSTER